MRQKRSEDGVATCHHPNNSTFRLNPYLFLTKINKVLQINIISVVDNGIVDHLGHFTSCLERKMKKYFMDKKSK